MTVLTSEMFDSFLVGIKSSVGIILPIALGLFIIIEGIVLLELLKKIGLLGGGSVSSVSSGGGSVWSPEYTEAQQALLDVYESRSGEVNSILEMPDGDILTWDNEKGDFISADEWYESRGTIDTHVDDIEKNIGRELESPYMKRILK